MVGNGAEDVKICGSGDAECPETTVEIKIKTLDSRTYTLRVDKCMPVPALKEQIATVTGVLTEQQRLICRGKVLKDDQLLSAYHVEDGHTLHLVVRQPSSESTPDPQATASASSAGYSQGNRVSPGVVVGTYSSSEHGDGIFPDLNRIVTAVLGSFGISSAGSGNDGIDLNGFGPASLGNMRGSSRSQTEQADTRDQSSFTTSASARPTDVPLEALQAPVIPDSLTTLTQYLSHLTVEFRANVSGQSETTQAAGAHVADRTNLDAIARSTGQRVFPTPASLVEVIILTRQLFMEQVAECLSQLSTLLENQANVTEPTERMRIQSYALRTGGLFRNIGAMLLELGRTTMTLRMGETPDDAVVNAGPAVFVSTAGPNPIMVQPLPFQPGPSFGAIPVGTVQNSTGFSGVSASSGFIPRNIDIRIRTGSFTASNPNRREPTGSQQPGQATQTASNGGSSDQQNTGGTRSSSAGESAVRVVPIRTVVAAVPTSVGRSTSDSARSPMGIFYPVLARVQHVSSGNSTQASDQNSLHGVETRDQANPDSAGQQQNIGLPSVEGNFSSFSEVSNVEEFSAQDRSRVDQLLRSLFSSENVHHENVNDHGVSTNFASGDGAAAENNSNSQETAAAGDEGVFLSNILRHIMPIISETNGTSSTNLPSDRSNMDEDGINDRQTQAQENTEQASSSHWRRDPPLPPSSKRQKGE
ncbi:ubiquitin-like domain-containing protein CIP73 isoform X2 [Lycium barbarum]|uniref:ubiquitin-like domain-containing protein CIP73 isoform X2 n=1 Tax=Lycium barbarum TaxID=112863 RepID=UPI00293F0368|nr:ubiquitin-like domain-containing protein CIP73 isoform X2 [Lycium barbarum]